MGDYASEGLGLGIINRKKEENKKKKPSTVVTRPDECHLFLYCVFLPAIVERVIERASMCVGQMQSLVKSNFFLISSHGVYYYNCLQSL